MELQRVWLNPSSKAALVSPRKKLCCDEMTVGIPPPNEGPLAVDQRTPTFSRFLYRSRFSGPRGNGS